MTFASSRVSRDTNLSEFPSGELGSANLQNRTAPKDRGRCGASLAPPRDAFGRSFSPKARPGEEKVEGGGGGGGTRIFSPSGTRRDDATMNRAHGS